MKKIIDQFVSNKNVALIGVSKDKTKFGNALVKELSKKGYSVFPVHPELREAEGIKCYTSLDDLPENVNNLILAVQPKVTEEIVGVINPLKIQRIWIKGSASEQAIHECRNKGIEVVYGFCPLMFFTPGGVHGFHFWLRKTFGKLPPDYKAHAEMNSRN